MQNISRDCHRRVLPGKRHSGRTLYAKAQSEPYAREEKYNSSGLTCHLKEAVRARNSIACNHVTRGRDSRSQCLCDGPVATAEFEALPARTDS